MDRYALFTFSYTIAVVIFWLVHPQKGLVGNVKQLHFYEQVLKEQGSITQNLYKSEYITSRRHNC